MFSKENMLKALYASVLAIIILVLNEGAWQYGKGLNPLIMLVLVIFICPLIIMIPDRKLLRNEFLNKYINLVVLSGILTIIFSVVYFINGF